MDIKTQRSHPVQLVVRASKKIIKSNFIKRINYDKSKFRRDLLPSPEDYYPKLLRQFTRSKSQARALCPFHEEKNPSFTVNLKTGAFLCFACGARGGDVLSFHMKYNELNFIAASKALGVWHE